MAYVKFLVADIEQDGTLRIKWSPLSHSPETKSLFSNLAELSMIRDLTQGGDHGRLFGESGTSDDAAVSIVG